MSMPDEIELPGVRDFCRGVHQNPKGQCCFQGWRMRLFPTMNTVEHMQFGHAAFEEGKKMGIHSLPSIHYLTHANDNVKNTKVKLVKWFENTVKALGYDIS